MSCPNSSNKFSIQIYIINLDQQTSIHYSFMIYGVLSDQSIFHLAGNFLRNCALTDTQINYFALKISKPYHSEISLHNLFMTPLFYVLCSETVYSISFVSKIHVCTLVWPVLHLLDIHILTFDYVHLHINVKVPCGLFIIIWKIFTSYPWILHKQHVSFL